MPSWYQANGSWLSRLAAVARGIFDHRLARIDVAEELGLDPLERGLERRVGRLVPRRIAFELCLKRIDPFGIQRVVAGETVLRIDGEPVLLVLQLAEEG